MTSFCLTTSSINIVLIVEDRINLIIFRIRSNYLLVGIEIDYLENNTRLSFINELKVIVFIIGGKKIISIKFSYKRFTFFFNKL